MKKFLEVLVDDNGAYHFSTEESFITEEAFAAESIPYGEPRVFNTERYATVEETGFVSAKDDPLWSPNLPAGLLACFGAGRPGGELPVDIFRLGEDYYPTEEILWNRGAARNAADREAQ